MDTLFLRGEPMNYHLIGGQYYFFSRQNIDYDASLITDTATNTADIASNDVELLILTSVVGTNTANVSTNTVNIASNALEIADLAAQSELLRTVHCN